MAKAFGEVSTGLLIVIYFIIIAALGIFGDLFTFIVGSLIITLIFANGYDSEHLGDH
ncbi:hypothetical protein GVN16_05125 [Emticicia sp. CRIBPO]|uniref:hypothetical protein n=1 Tax=Emticicia sp. CRIBPO TaxID=2683258 RepID=UPI001412B42C|nr:hypothetical protein [Emticicia sp. CRIBPO]NBA85130.1 hypothetical protein [Emticicia sp. CRIBPO]